MKRRILRLFLVGTLLCTSTGCAKTQNASDMSDLSSASTVSVSENTGEEEQGDMPADASVQEISSSEADASSVSASSEAEEEKKINITIPQKEGMQSTYDTMEGLTMEPGSYIAVVAKDMESGYWQAVKAGAEQALKELNEQLSYTGDDKVWMTFEGPKDEADIETQINTIDAVIPENPAALCLGIIDMQSCQAQIENAKDNEIPVIITDSGVESDLIDGVCAIDNREAGAEAARRLCEAMGDAGQIMIVAHQYNTETSIERVEGFKEEIDKHPNVFVAQINYGDGEESVSEMISNTLEAYPGVTGIFCTNENMSEQTLDALEEMENADQFKMIGFDSGDKQIEAVREGREIGIITQNPYGLGYATIVAAVRAANDLPVDAFVDTGFQYLDCDTIDLEENQKYIYN